MSRWIELLARESAKGTTPTTLKTIKTPQGGGSEGFDGAHAGGFAAAMGSGGEVPRVLKVPEVAPSSQSRPAACLPAIRPDVLALVGLTDQEIGAMSARLAGLRRAGYGMDDAEQIADRLLMRDRTGLDMAACVECKRFTGRRCIAGEPVGLAHELRRCPAFRSVTE
ncbi:hypothetical protein [Sphaerotilus uruguayifluvii]|uniref:Uncharacterized protein n=1 Tax=Sphaerotilus uruguayifluvii TaxID=2735897 RepID=A0ABX2G8J4_9BURK|nr:hypothetical protein [Leptothrix sp. C29]NRT58661.1 hypothetical protein [Leptothrix sp. C29]